MTKTLEHALRRPRLLLGAIAAPLALAVALAGSAAPAQAALRHDLQRFANCPYNNPIVVKCLYGVTNGGEFVMGNAAVPITKEITIQGGLKEGGGVIPPTNGEILSRTPLKVPGGILGIELLGPLTEVTATAEVVGEAEIKSSVHLPLQVRLGNPLLGGNCTIGTPSEPVTLNMIYGTTSPPPPNEPISGELKITTRDAGNITVLSGRLVENAFPVPGVSGCGLLPFLFDPLIDAKEGLPSAAGKNTAIMAGYNEEAAAGTVRNTLPLPAIGRCVKVEGQPEGKKLVYHGTWENSSCTLEQPAHEGRYEWTEGPGTGGRFTSTGGTLKLTTASGAGLFCTASTGSGQWTGAKTASATLTLTGCHIGPSSKPTACQSGGAGEGEVVTSALNGRLDFIKEGEEPEIPVVGIDLAPQSGSTIASYSCGGKPFTLSGSLIAPVSAVDHMNATLHVKAAGSAGTQTPEAFEEGPKDVVSLGSEQAGVATSIGATSGEPLEIKAIP